MANISSGHEGCKIEPSPAMQSDAAKLSQNDIGFVLPVGPQPGYLESERGVG